eukprot:CAMPEP_0185265048 /NCGR_PEP_ID=MMETSP1359-20130426/26132_1 /TAXON_ID=552665 /ORGANISM="Bigelowiella longifila, Strain CCMP242" /LENGTH=93 /DNA_ID=CAMNT_0027854093 /DNA_START=315 /DNA_END=596 /DNA_ORIENTATION=+
MDVPALRRDIDSLLRDVGEVHPKRRCVRQDEVSQLLWWVSRRPDLAVDVAPGLVELDTDKVERVAAVLSQERCVAVAACIVEVSSTRRRMTQT